MSSSKHPNRGLRAASIPAVLIAGLAFNSAAMAGDRSSYPSISVEIPMEFQTDWVAESETPGAELRDSFLTIEPAITVNIVKGLKLETELALEPIRDPGPNDDRFIDDHGIYVSTLFMAYDAGPFAVQAGKFGPEFGIAWDQAPGIWGSEFAEDYELAERIGVGATVPVNGGILGNIDAAATVFMLDTTDMSRSWLSERPQTRRADAGASNTDDLSSFALAVTGSEIPEIPGLTYHFGYRLQNGGTGNPESEEGVVAALTYGFGVTENLSVETLAEYATFNGFNASADDQRYLTLSAQALYQNWNLATSYTKRDLLPAGGPNVDDHLFQLSVGYAFEFGLGIDVGWRHTEAGDAAEDTFGILLGYTLSF